jgi:sugar/nucleoside kinase (ribokinase family)
MTICCLGDLVLDVIVRLEQPLATNADATSRIVLRPGGQAANVAAWVSELGGRARFVGKRGADDAGLLASARLVELGVELVGPIETEGNGVIVALVDPSGERTMCSDRGVATGLRPDEVDTSWFDGGTHLHVSGYALLREPVGSAAREAIGVARKAGLRVSIDLSSWSAIRDFGAGRFREHLELLAPDVVFANEDEDHIVGGPIAGATWIVKRGASGAVFGGDELAAVPVANVVDSTGAGDAFAAGWLVGGPHLALEAGALCVQQAGSMPEQRSQRLGSHDDA